MKAIRCDLKFSGRFLEIEPLGDVHIGSPAVMMKKFEERIEMIKSDKNRYWIGMGDYIDNIRPWKRGVVDRRWCYSLLKGNLNWVEQWEEFVRLVKPIKDKCIGLLWGNHEWGTFEEDEFARMVEKDLGVPFLGARAIIGIRVDGKGVRKKDWFVFAVHGDYNGDTKGGALNRLKQLSQTVMANIYLYGHTHFKSTDKGERVYIRMLDGKLEMVREPIISVLTGGFVDPYCGVADTYFDRKPRGRDVRVGTVTVLIDPIGVKLYAVE